MRRTLTTTTLLLCTAALAASCALSATPAAATERLTPSTTIPLARTYGEMSLLAATGKTLVREVRVTTHSAERDYSTDNGATWRAAPSGITDEPMLGYKGVIVQLRRTIVQPGGEGCDTWTLDGFTVWTPSTGALRTVHATAAQKAVVSECLSLADTVTGLVMLSDGRLLDIRGGTAADRRITWGAGTPSGDHSGGNLSADGTTVVRLIGVWDNALNRERTYLAVGRVDGGTPPATREVKGMSELTVSGQSVHYLVTTSKKIAVCRAPLATPSARTCTTLRSRGARGFEAYLNVSRGLEQVSYHLSNSEWTWLVRGAKVRKLASTSAVGEVSGTGFRDPDRPLVKGVSRTRGQVYGRVSASLRVNWSIRSRRVPALVGNGGLALTPNRVTALDSRPYQRDGGPGVLWYRTLSGTTVGPEVRLASPGKATGIFASAARTAADCCLSVKAKFYDHARVVLSKRLTFNVKSISGPYVAGDDAVMRMDAKTWHNGDGPAIFGSLVATLDAGTRVVTVRDLAAPTTPAITVTLPPGREYYPQDLRLWGDRIAIGWGDADDPDADQGTLVRDYRTGQSWTTATGRLASLGDGFALLYRSIAPAPGDDEGRTVLAWNFLTDDAVAVPVRPDHEVTMDGISQVAWVDDAAIQVARIPGAGATAPRLLGVLAKSSFTAGRTWKPRLDASKQLDAGTFELRNRAGVVVRTLRSKPAASGSVRTLSWNGRDAAGHKVPAGTYTWVWRVNAKDGTGTLTDVTGRGPARGTVKVTR